MIWSRLDRLVIVDTGFGMITSVQLLEPVVRRQNVGQKSPWLCACTVCWRAAHESPSCLGVPFNKHSQIMLETLETITHSAEEIKRSESRQKKKKKNFLDFLVVEFTLFI